LTTKGQETNRNRETLKDLGLEIELVEKQEKLFS